MKKGWSETESVHLNSAEGFTGGVGERIGEADGGQGPRSSPRASLPSEAVDEVLTIASDMYASVSRRNPVFQGVVDGGHGREERRVPCEIGEGSLETGDQPGPDRLDVFIGHGPLMPDDCGLRARAWS